MDIKPFKIVVPQSSLDSLQEKLSLATFPDQVDFSDDWDFGAPLAEVKRLTEYWRDKFDWETQQDRLNSIPQFTTDIAVDGFGDLNIHFIHQKSSHPDSIPLLFCHGWPGSFLEVTKILPLLTTSSDGPHFHVVAPSLPNFGFSDAVQKPGFSIPHYAQTIHKLMIKLGYNKYVTQGGDWGFFITRSVALQFPDHCLAGHINFLCAAPTLPKLGWLGLQSVFKMLSADEKAGLKRSKWYLLDGSGYMVQQGSKPSTLGFGLHDSPVALLSWIYEKLRDWTDDYSWTEDEILTWISVYQFSKAGPAASLRIYYEAKHTQPEHLKATTKHVPAPLGISYFPLDLLPVPKSWARGLGHVIFEGTHEQGGHFAAWEKPEEFAGDVKYFGKAVTDLFGHFKKQREEY